MQYRGAAMWFVLAGGVALGLGLHFTGMLDSFRFSSIRGSRPQFLLANHFFGMQNIRLSSVETPAELAALLAQVCRELPVQSLTLSVAGGKDQAVCLWRWPAGTDTSTPPPSAASGLADRAQLADAQTAAEWILDARREAPEIAVEYRVLTNDFMRQALGKADEFCRRLGTDQVQAAMRDAPSASLLLLRGGERP
jgi:hypothetical protein